MNNESITEKILSFKIKTNLVQTISIHFLIIN